MPKTFRGQLRDILAPYAEGAEGVEGVDFDIVEPKEEFGHYATNIAFGLAKKEGGKPARIAGEIVSSLQKSKKAKKLFSDISVASPGFINFSLSPRALQDSLHKIIFRGLAFWKINSPSGGKKVNIEFVSANPTGPLTLGNGRAAAYGDALSRILDFAGFSVTKEYFINNVGRQVELLGESVARRFLQIHKKKTDFPEELYRGEYIIAIAKQLKKEGVYHGTLDNFEALKKASQKYASKYLLENIKDTLHDFGLDFDVWFSELTLHERKEIDLVLDDLRQKGLLYEAEGAVWFRAKDFGLDKDVVLRKSIGDKATTYLASDFAYAKNKIDRGFAKNIYILGADHHGDVMRIKAGVNALGLDESKFKFLIHQLVALKKGGKRRRMSKRRGEFVTLSELMKEVPVDIIRFFFLEKSLDKHMEFDLDLAKEESKKNPVYYIQYAHARINSLIETLKERKINWKKKPGLKELEVLREKEALRLIILMNRFPEVMEDIVRNFQIHHLTTYVYELASAVHLFYEKYRIIDSESALLGPRMNLLVSADEVICLGLALLGVSAPDKM